MSDDPRQEDTEPAGTDIPTRPNTMIQSVAWPDTAHLPAQQQAANRMFRINSETLQRQQARGAEIESDIDLSKLPVHDLPHENSAPETKTLEPGDYAGLRLETARLRDRDLENLPPEIPEGELTFARDRRDRDMGDAALERETKEGELSFARARTGHDLSRG